MFAILSFVGGCCNSALLSSPLSFSQDHLAEVGSFASLHPALRLIFYLFFADLSSSRKFELCECSAKRKLRFFCMLVQKLVAFCYSCCHTLISVSDCCSSLSFVASVIYGCCCCWCSYDKSFFGRLLSVCLHDIFVEAFRKWRHPVSM